MKVLVLTPGVFDKGGIARYGRFQIKALRNEFGEENVRVISMLGPTSNALEEPFLVDWSGSEVIDLSNRIRFALATLRIAFSQRPNVIVSAHVNLGPMANVISRMANARLAQNIYGREIWSGLSKSRTLSLRTCDAIISDCLSTARKAQELGLTTKTPTVIWDCADLKKYAPGASNVEVLEKYGIAPCGRFRILLVARLRSDTRYKGTERVLQVLSMLPPSCEVVFGGTGNDLEHLRELSVQLGLEDRVFFTGAIDEEDLPEIYRSASVVYLTSEAGFAMGEGIPLTPIEGLACGIPVIVGNTDGSRELIEGKGGICLDPADLAGQVAYILKMKKDSDFAASEGREARLRAEAAFGFPEFSSRMVDAVISLRGPGRVRTQ